MNHKNLLSPESIDYEWAIDAQNMSKHYADFTLNHVTLQVPKGTITGFFGQNGAGKTNCKNTSNQSRLVEQATIFNYSSSSA